MKSSAFTYVVLADQVSSRAGADHVPAALAHLGSVLGDRLVLPFERTAGDEIQGLCGDSVAVVDAVCELTRLGGWRIGIGAGGVETPLPSSTREARGEAYVAARKAIGNARSSPTQLALVDAGGAVGGDDYGGRVDDVMDAETALWLLRGALQQRSQEGWELMDLLDQGLTGAEAAAALGISPSAVSQRLSRARRTEGTRGAALASRLLARLGEEPSS
jgi:hypothetical protein